MGKRKCNSKYRTSTPSQAEDDLTSPRNNHRNADLSPEGSGSLKLICAEGSFCHVALNELLVEESWLKALPGELQKPYFKTLSDFLERESKGPLIYPPQNLVFSALNTTPFDRVKAVIIGQDPYHGPGQAMGLSFSVPEGEKLPSSL
ncbi:hypothetical protein YC2023_012172 [Brassica napus]